MHVFSTSSTFGILFFILKLTTFVLGIIIYCMPSLSIFARIAQKLSISTRQVENTIQLMSDGATVHFIARYRKEMTGELNEMTILKIKDFYEQFLEIEKRRTYILDAIRKQEKLTPDIEKQIIEAETLDELEDLYLPFKPKKQTKAQIARQKGLEPLALQILKQEPIDIETFARKFVNKDIGVLSNTDAIEGACHIIAEIINEDADLRKQLRELFQKKATIQSTVIASKKEEAHNYEMYFKHSERAMNAPSHRILAMFRGEKEGYLRIQISPPQADALMLIERKYVKAKNQCSELVRSCCSDAWKRLLQSSLENEMRRILKQKADEKAIQVFAENVKQLLLQPPLGHKRVLAIDPGYRTGCKIAILDETGQLLHNETIYPHPPQSEVKDSIKKIALLVEAFKIEAIAIGNGTASRETEQLIKQIIFSRPVKAYIVNEAGASVYSVSNLARTEFPNYDVTVRSAVSIGRRLQDPLAELVKIDPKSLGVGQYQHDVDQSMLQKSLEQAVAYCVNLVGVDVNSASKELLQYVSGIGPALAQNIIDYRHNNGMFCNRKELMKVPRFGAKVFEQAAGFLRIRNGDNPLDNTAVHPESYHIVEKMLKKLNITIEQLVNEKQRKQKYLSHIRAEDFVDDQAGLPTIKDILLELEKPGRDPRQDIEIFEFDKNIKNITDLKPGMILPGIVTNITAFGIFVDIGIHENGFVHISQMSDSYINDPLDVVHLYQKIKVRVLDIDLVRKRIQLSMKNV